MGTHRPTALESSPTRKALESCSSRKETANSIACPRCGYDQRGLVETWREACPLVGRCSECGLEFEWKDVVNSERRRLPGFVEHEEIGQHGRGVLKAAWRTFLWTVLPWRFWGRVEMHHPVRMRRWVVWLLLVIGLMHVVTAGMTAVQMTVSREWQTSPMVQFNRRVQIRIVAAAGTPPALPLASKLPSRSWTEAACMGVNSVAYPFAGISSEYVNPTTLAISMATPKRWHAALLPEGGWKMMSAGLGMTVAFPILVVLLPQTRRVARVRLVHVGRGFVYSLGWIVVPMALVLVRTIWVLIHDLLDIAQLQGATLDDVDWLLMVMVVAWLSVWWLMCLWKGLKLPRAGVVWGVLMAPALLAVLAAVMYVELYLRDR